MSKQAIDFETVRSIGLQLPGVEESTAYGMPALKVNGQLLACAPANRAAESGSIVLRVDFETRAELLAAAPDVYYLPDHYVDYNAVLVRRARVTPDLLGDQLRMAYKIVTAEKPTPAASRARRKRPAKS